MTNKFKSQHIYTLYCFSYIHFTSLFVSLRYVCFVVQNRKACVMFLICLFCCCSISDLYLSHCGAQFFFLFFKCCRNVYFACIQYTINCCCIENVKYCLYALKCFYFTCLSINNRLLVFQGMHIKTKHATKQFGNA